MSTEPRPTPDPTEALAAAIPAWIGWTARGWEPDVRVRFAEAIVRSLSAAGWHLTPDGDGAARIAIERRRQIEVEGWSDEHDEEVHGPDSLATAGAVYALPAALRGDLWPWERQWFKPTPDDRIRELEKAGALIAAEIDLRLAALDAPAQPVHPEPPLTDAAIAEQRWQARHAQPVHPEPLDVAVQRAKAYQPQCSKCGHDSVLHNGPKLLCRAVFRGAWGPCTCPGYVPRLREASEPEGAKE